MKIATNSTSTMLPQEAAATAASQQQQQQQPNHHQEQHDKPQQRQQQQQQQAEAHPIHSLTAMLQEHDYRKESFKRRGTESSFSISSEDYSLFSEFDSSDSNDDSNDDSHDDSHEEADEKEIKQNNNHINNNKSLATAQFIKQMSMSMMLGSAGGNNNNNNNNNNNVISGMANLQMGARRGGGGSGSVGGGPAAPTTGAAAIAVAAGLRRSGSDSGLATSKVVHIVQTKGATDKAWHHDENCPSPQETLLKLLEQKGVSAKPCSGQDFAKQQQRDHEDSYWVPWNQEGYTVELTTAVRQGDLETIQNLHQKAAASKSHHNPLQCSNRYGESIVHMAARHGKTDILEYLVNEANVSLRVLCEGQRTLWHDFCWQGCNQFGLETDCLLFLLQQCPEYLLVQDKRGFCPLHYVPRDAWPEWNDFLQKHAEMLQF